MMCRFCSRQAVRTFRMKVPTCEGHYVEMLKEQRSWYRGKIKSKDRILFNKVCREWRAKA